MSNGPSNILLALKTISLSDEISGTEKRVAVAIIDHYNHKTGQCDPALGSVAALLRLHKRTVIRAINSLVRKGFIRKIRHGGHFHRNQYEPVWTRFAAGEVGWNDRRQQMRKNRVAVKLSPLQRQSCHSTGDDVVTQTCPINPINLTSARDKAADRLPASSALKGQRGSAEQRSRPSGFDRGGPYIPKLFAKPRDASIDAAERRWNDGLMRRYVDKPEVFSAIIDAIDVELAAAATGLELRRPGAGFDFIIQELQSKLRLGPTAPTPNPGGRVESQKGYVTSPAANLHTQKSEIK